MSDTTHRSRRVDRRAQRSLFDEPIPKESDRGRERDDSGFVDPDPRDLFFGNQRLQVFLADMELEWVIDFRRLIRQLDFTEFEEAYTLQGRPPYAPAAMLGLTLYGLMTGRTSLRELEVMARSDLGAMWISGGIFPDHSILGRFLVRHKDALGETLFEQMAGKIIEECKLDARVLSGDGTTLEAVSSRFRTVSLEAAQAYADRLRETIDEHTLGEASGEDAQRLRTRLKKADQVVEAGRKRAKSQGRSKAATAKLQVVITEPEAALLRHKRGRYAPGYTPSVLATEDRVIVAAAVDATNELAVVEEMVEQAEHVRGEPVETLLLDSNYHRHPIVELAVERDIDLLCPSPEQTSRQRGAKTPGSQSLDASADGGEKAKFSKHDFCYLKEDDVLVCPAGFEMKPGKVATDGPTQRKYRTFYSRKKNCQTCPLREQCTESARGRRVKRFEGAETLEVLRQVMEHPAAQSKYTQRMGAVEPVFAEMKTGLGLTRFGRYGLAGVRLEFALYAMAYNLRRWKVLSGAGSSRKALVCACTALMRAIWTLWSGSKASHRNVISKLNGAVSVPTPLGRERLLAAAGG